MVEPSRRNSRRALAGSVALAVALAAGGFVAGRKTNARPEPVVTAPTPDPTPPPTAAPPVPAVTPPLGRADLLAAARLAADAFASGEPLPPELGALDGRRFEVRLPFGCLGPSPKDGSLGWRYDETAEALRVRAAPTLFDAAPLLDPDAAKNVDSIEGFWVDRPWTTSEVCPFSPSMPGGEQSPGPERTLALAQFYLARESRVGRRDGEAFEVVKKGAREELRLERGLRLRLSGRVAAAPGNGPILCRAPAGRYARPTCLAAVSLDQVAVENPVTGATLATWELSHPALTGS